MGIKKLLPKVIGFVASTIIVVVAFNNCAKTAPQSVGISGYQSYSINEAKLVQNYQGLLDPLFCENPKNYTCQLKIFSKSVESSIGKISTECLQLKPGNSFCVETETRYYNSLAAEQSCGPGCNENYEYSEYDCHLKLAFPGNATYPLYFSSPQMIQAVDSLYHSCLKIVEGSH